MKIAKVALSLVVVLGIALLAYVVSRSRNDAKGESIVHAFMADKGITIRKNTEAYMYFMRDILLGDYPELTGRDSKYVHNQREMDLLLEYATEQMSPLFAGSPKEPDVPEALMPAD